MAKRRGLDPERILKAAEKLADRKGIEGLSMRPLAAKLKVEAMSLYHHFASKDALLDAMVDRIYGQIHFEADPGEWRRSLADRAYAIRAVLQRHPWALGLLDSRRSPGFATLHHHNKVIGLLREAGFPWDLTAHTYALIDSYIYGFILQEQSIPVQQDEKLKDLAEQMMKDFPREELPYLAAFTEKYVLRPGYDYGEEFEYGLTLLLDGIERRFRPDHSAADV